MAGQKVTVRTMAEAVDRICKDIKPLEFEKTRRIAQVLDLEKMATNAHHTVGRTVRNVFGLWEERGADLRQSIWDGLPPEKQEYYRSYWRGKHTGREMHPDDASHALLVATLRQIKEGPELLYHTGPPRKWVVKIDRKDGVSGSFEVTAPDDCQATVAGIEKAEELGFIKQNDPLLDFGTIYDPVLAEEKT